MHLALFSFRQFIKQSEHPDNGGVHALNDEARKVVGTARDFVARSE